MYIARKSCRISGKNYVKGDIISTEDLPIYEGARLVKYGIISELPEDAECVPKFVEVAQTIVAVPILSLDGKTLDWSIEDVAEALRVLQMSSEDAAAYVKDTQSDTLCNLLGFVDKRKGVLAALSKRSAKKEAAEDNEQGTEKSVQEESEHKTDENGGDE